MGKVYSLNHFSNLKNYCKTYGNTFNIRETIEVCEIKNQIDLDAHLERYGIKESIESEEKISG